MATGAQRAVQTVLQRAAVLWRGQSHNTCSAVSSEPRAQRGQERSRTAWLVGQAASEWGGAAAEAHYVAGMGMTCITRRVCVCSCVCVWRSSTHTHTHKHACAHTPICQGVALVAITPEAVGIKSLADAVFAVEQKCGGVARALADRAGKFSIDVQERAPCDAVRVFMVDDVLSRGGWGKGGWW